MKSPTTIKYPFALELTGVEAVTLLDIFNDVLEDILSEKPTFDYAKKVTPMLKKVRTRLRKELKS